jgi:hypothetical protein
MPRAILEDRVVKSLRTQGVLRQDKRRVIELTPLRALAAVAASMLLVVGGFALGRSTEPRQAPYEDTTIMNAKDISVAAALQRAGSAYVLAIQNFAALPGSSAGDDEMRQGREVAIKTLSTAADKVSKFVPKYYLAGQLLDVINAGGKTVPVDTTGSDISNVIWF